MYDLMNVISAAETLVGVTNDDIYLRLPPPPLAGVFFLTGEKSSSSFFRFVGVLAAIHTI